MGKLNVANRTLAVMDNLAFLRRLNNECIDLIAIDPPFAANETFTGNPRPPISDAEYAEEIALAQAHGVAHNEGQGLTRVHDIWSWDEDVHPAWKMSIEDDYPEVFAVIQAVEACASENEAAYIAFMAARLLECRRVLKPTGSIYLHCDSHANSYLRMLMDAVFGSDNCRSEITWRRTNAKGLSFKSYPNNHDTLLYYSKSDNFIWNRSYRPHEPEYVEQFYRHVEPETGRRYRLSDLSNPNRNRPNLTYEWNGHLRVWRWTKERMQEAHDEGIIHYSSTGLASQKRYLDEMQGNPVDTIWDDIKPIQAQAKERTGYATQKPLELYERIINASSNPGDVVLDIFAGCATTAVAAETLERQWVACDMAYRAWTMLKRRFYLNGIALEGMTDATKDALASVRKDRGFQEPQQWTTSRVIGPADLPQRDDEDPAPHHALRSAAGGRRGARQSTQSSSWSGRISKEEAKQLLMDKFGPRCWGSAATNPAGPTAAWTKPCWKWTTSAPAGPPREPRATTNSTTWPCSTAPATASNATG